MNTKLVMSINPIDGGPIYAETDLSSFISEPWNAISSLAIALPSVYWAIKLRKHRRQYSFLYFLMPLLFLGGMGSTFYHAFRSSKLLLWMDVAPTSMVTLSVGVYFWDKILSHKWQVVAIIVPFTIFRLVISEIVPGQLGTNLSYFIVGFLIFFPIIFFLIKRKFRDVKPVFISVSFLSLSLIMRRLDFEMVGIFPMGSHFLWHLFSGVGAYYLAQFIYFIRTEELINSSK